jgi:hypothetical protein
LFEPPDTIDLPGSPSQENIFLPFKGLRTASYLYVEYESGEKELYDLKADPYELDNLAGPAQEGLMAQLSAWLRRLAACAGADCREAENSGGVQK